MKIIIFSDSHGSINGMLRTVEKTIVSADVYIHCGDGLKEFNILRERYPERGFIGVCGNRDLIDGEVYEIVTDLCGYRTLIVHSHYDLLTTAKSKNCKIVLYGHSHARKCEYIDGIYLFNPGSVYNPRDGKPPSYGVMEVRNNGILFSHGDIP